MSDPIPFRPYAAGTQPPLNVPAYLGTTKRHPLRAPVKMPHTITNIANAPVIRSDLTLFLAMLASTIRSDSLQYGAAWAPVEVR